MNFYESWRDKGKFLDKPSSRGEERWSNCNYFPGWAQHLPPSPACIALKDSHKINHTRDSAIITVIISKWKLLTSEIKQLMLDLNYTTINQSKQQHFLVCKITSNRGHLWQFLCMNMKDWQLQRWMGCCKLWQKTSWHIRDIRDNDRLIHNWWRRMLSVSRMRWVLIKSSILEHFLIHKINSRDDIFCLVLSVGMTKWHCCTVIPNLGVLGN